MMKFFGGILRFYGGRRETTNRNWSLKAPCRPPLLHFASFVTFLSPSCSFLFPVSFVPFAHYFSLALMFTIYIIMFKVLLQNCLPLTGVIIATGKCKYFGGEYTLWRIVGGKSVAVICSCLKWLNPPGLRRVTVRHVDWVGERSPKTINWHHRHRHRHRQHPSQSTDIIIGIRHHYHPHQNRDHVIFIFFPLHNCFHKFHI